jgi:hypothetical protein
MNHWNMPTQRRIHCGRLDVASDSRAGNVVLTFGDDYGTGSLSADIPLSTAIQVAEAILTAAQTVADDMRRRTVEAGA